MEEAPHNVESNDFPIKIEEEEDSEKETKITDEVRKCQKKNSVFFENAKNILKVHLLLNKGVLCVKL